MTHPRAWGSAALQMVLPYLLVCLIAVPGRSEAFTVAPVMQFVGSAEPQLLYAWSIASIGDFNGDGYEDLVVGGRSESVASHGWVYFGGPAADSNGDVLLLRDPLLTFSPYTPVASAGDMNGDGFGDIVVATPSSGIEGQARVYFGGSNPDGIPDLTLQDWAGNWLAFAPQAVAAADYNGDGISDLALGAPGYWDNFNYGGDDVGRTYLFFGGKAADGEADLILESPSMPLPGSFFQGFGGVVAAAGDLNGDTFGDLIVAPHHPYNHLPFVKTFMYLGGPNIDSIPDGSMATIPRSNLPGQGPLITSAGDLNGDGYGDVAVEAIVLPASGSGPATFVVHIYFGKSEMSFSTSPDLTLDTDSTDGLRASSVSGGRDVNGDGYPDLVVGSPLQAAAYIYFGGAAFDATPDIVLTGERSDTWFGASGALADWTGDGIADVVITAPNTFNGVPSHVFIYDVAEPLRARVLPNAERRPIPIADAAPAPLRMRFEPLDNSYASGDVDPASIRLRSDATGEVSEIPATAGKASPEGDWDRNGVTDLLASFSGSDLARLFSNVGGRKTVDVTLEGRLRSRRRFAAPFSLTIVGTGPRRDLTAAVQPNPLNPRGTLSFRTESLGFVTARLFDLQGRCVRVLLQRQTLAPGNHQLPIDGRDDAGHDLASGVYFYRVDSPDGPARGRIVVAK